MAGWLLLALVLGLLAACRPTPTPGPTPTPTATATPTSNPTSTSTPMPTATPTLAPTPTLPETETPSASWPTWVDGTHGVRIPYPPEWTLAPADPMMAEALLAALNNSPLTPWVPTEATESWAPSLIGVGTIPTGATPARLLLNWMEADLTLDALVALLRDELTAVEGMQVERAEVVSGWRPLGAEIGLVRFRWQTPGVALRAWQVAVLDEDRRSFLLISLAGPEEVDPNHLETQLRQVVQRIVFASEE